MSIHRYTVVIGVAAILFGLKVGETGLAPFHATRSPFGCHIIKRTR